MKNIHKLTSIIATASMAMIMSCIKTETPVTPPIIIDTIPTNKGVKTWTCVIPVIQGDTAPNYAKAIGCKADFDKLSSEPLNASIPGARSGKTVINLLDGGSLYFQNSKKYEIHFQFVSKNLSGTKGTPVFSLTDFNNKEYYQVDRNFILGAITRYDGPKIWTYEIAPYDKASADMIAYAYKKIADSCFFGDSLYFHPTSQSVTEVAKGLPSTVKVISTDDLFKNIDFQPLNIDTGMGKLVFMTAVDLQTKYVSFRDIVVLDEVPNDISACSKRRFRTSTSSRITAGRPIWVCGALMPTKSFALLKINGLSSSLAAIHG
jgi:hypothetical protein